MNRHKPPVDVAAYLPLVRGILRNLKPMTPSWLVDSEDLVQEGATALIVAYDRFDPSQGAAFTTFAYWRVRGAMIDAIRHAWRAHGHHVPVELKERDQFRENTLALERALVVGRLGRLDPRQELLVSEWLEGRTDAERARTEGKHRSTITRERHSALAALDEPTPCR